MASTYVFIIIFFATNGFVLAKCEIYHGFSYLNALVYPRFFYIQFKQFCFGAVF